MVAIQKSFRSKIVFLQCCVLLNSRKCSIAPNFTQKWHHFWVQIVTRNPLLSEICQSEYDISRSSFITSWFEIKQKTK